MKILSRANGKIVRLVQPFNPGGIGTMKTTRRWQFLCTLGFGLALATVTGCQTWVTEAGVTLPSGHYIDHPPQYIPPSPAFPLSRELASMEAAGAAGAPGAQPAPLPPPGGGPIP